MRLGKDREVCCIIFDRRPSTALRIYDRIYDRASRSPKLVLRIVSLSWSRGLAVRKRGQNYFMSLPDKSLGFFLAFFLVVNEAIKVHNMFVYHEIK